MVSLAVDNPKKSQMLSSIKYLLVDEYQDINRAQRSLVQLIGRNAGIFIVGDPRQTIYKWRGSDETCFETLLRSTPCGNHLPNGEQKERKRDNRPGKRLR